MRTRPILTSAVALASAARAQTVELGISKAPQSSLHKRASNVFDTPAQNLQVEGGYFISVEVGTPGQKLTLQLDTGSSDVWVPSGKAQVCTRVSRSNPGCELGTFDSGSSTTFQEVGSESFSIQYIDGSFAKGDYIEDTFKMGGAVVQNLTMGYGTDTTIPNGIIGVGYRTNEASLTTTGNTYPNLPVTMQADGLINSVAFSLWLNDLDASQGSILFGGIDTEKYVGTLTALDLSPSTAKGTVTEFAVQLYSLNASSSSGSDVLPEDSNANYLAILDSGTTLTYLPQQWATQVWEEVGAIYDPDIQLALLPCSMLKAEGEFTFGFYGPNGPKISVPMNELVLDITNGQPPTFPAGPYKGQSACEFGIVNETSPPYLLGDTFLRSAYVVYDLVNNQVGIAPTKFNADGSNIVPFSKMGAAIPSATPAAGPQGQILVDLPKKKFAAQAGFQKNLQKSAAGPLTTGFSRVGAAVVLLSVAHALFGSTGAL